MIVTGVLAALFAALSKSGKSVLAKAASTGSNEYIATVSMRLVTAVILTISSIFITHPSVTVNNLLLGAFIANTVLLGGLAVVLNRAYKVSDTSLVAPLVGLTPVVTIFPTMLLTDDVFSVIGVIGVLLTGIGGLVVLSRGNFSISKLRRHADDSGVRLVFIFLLFVGFIPPIDKIGVQQTSPIIWSAIINASSGLFIAGLMFLRNKTNVEITKRTVGILFIFGLFNAGIWVGQSFAYKVMNPAYVQAIKRSSILVAVFVGNNIYDEEYLRSRLFGAALIFAGVVLLILPN